MYLVSHPIMALCQIWYWNQNPSKNWAVHNEVFPSVHLFFRPNFWFMIWVRVCVHMIHSYIMINRGRIIKRKGERESASIRNVTIFQVLMIEIARKRFNTDSWSKYSSTVFPNRTSHGYDLKVLRLKIRIDI